VSQLTLTLNDPTTASMSVASRYRTPTELGKAWEKRRQCEVWGIRACCAGQHQIDAFCREECDLQDTIALRLFNWQRDWLLEDAGFRRNINGLYAEVERLRTQKSLALEAFATNLAYLEGLKKSRLAFEQKVLVEYKDKYSDGESLGVEEKAVEAMFLGDWDYFVDDTLVGKEGHFKLDNLSHELRSTSAGRARRFLPLSGRVSHVWDGVKMVFGDWHIGGEGYPLQQAWLPPQRATPLFTTPSLIRFIVCIQCPSLEYTCRSSRTSRRRWHLKEIADRSKQLHCYVTSADRSKRQRCHAWRAAKLPRIMLG
jgi:hypothetical protein